MNIRDRILRWARNREPDFVIGGHEHPYLRRHWLIPRNRFFNVYVHQFLRSDDDRALHDHPYLFNASWLLEGGYREWTFCRDYWFTHAHSDELEVTPLHAGSWKFRWGKAPHRVELLRERMHHGGYEKPCWTVFITGPRVREWGFYCPKRWIPWREFVDDRDAGSVGKGCEQ